MPLTPATEIAVWNPWEEYKAPFHSTRQAMNELPIAAPPCPNCRYWYPARKYQAIGDSRDKNPVFDGVRLCHSENQFNDFSCFRPAVEQGDSDAPARPELPDREKEVAL